MGERPCRYPIFHTFNTGESRDVCAEVPNSHHTLGRTGSTMRLRTQTILRTEPRASSLGDGCTSMLTVVPVVNMGCTGCTQGVHRVVYTRVASLPTYHGGYIHRVASLPTYHPGTVGRHIGRDTHPGTVGRHIDGYTPPGTPWVYTTCYTPYLVHPGYTPPVIHHLGIP